MAADIIAQRRRIEALPDRDEHGYLKNWWPSLSAPLPDAELIVLALGGGVQSTTLLHMAAHGEIGPMPHLAIMADTVAETRAIYDHVRHLQSPNVAVPFPIEIVSAGDLGAAVLRSCRSSAADMLRVANPPFFTRGPLIETKSVWVEPLPLLGLDGEQVELIVQHSTERETLGMLKRSCTKEYKIRPITKAIRRQIGLRERQRGPAAPIVELWFGLTTDELDRVSYSDVSFIQHRVPLIEARMSRADCIEWLIRHGYPIPPKSRCYFCPFQSNALWLEMKLEAPEEFEAACALDRAIRHGIRGTTHQLYLHESRTPLEDVDFTQPSGLWTADGLRAECQGRCGT
jgi:hypothetical protein